MVRLKIGCLLLLFSLILTGCWDSKEVDDMAYVISLGLDQRTQNKLQVSMLIAIPKNITEGGGGSVSGTDGKSKNPGSETSEVVTPIPPNILSLPPRRAPIHLLFPKQVLKILLRRPSPMMNKLLP